MTPGLGPPRPAQHAPAFRRGAHRRLPRLVCRSRSPNRVAKRFPDWTAVGFRYKLPSLRRLALRRTVAFKQLPGPSKISLRETCGTEAPTPLVPRIACPSRPFLAHFRHAGSDAPPIGELSSPGQRSLRRRHVTPTPQTFGASLAAILTRSACRALSSPLVPGGLIAGRRLPPCPRFIASQGLRFKEAGLTYGSRFPLSPCTFVSDDEGKYTKVARNRQKYRTRRKKLSTARAQPPMPATVDR